MKRRAHTWPAALDGEYKERGQAFRNHVAIDITGKESHGRLWTRTPLSPFAVDVNSTWRHDPLQQKAGEGRARHGTSG